MFVLKKWSKEAVNNNNDDSLTDNDFVLGNKLVRRSSASVARFLLYIHLPTCLLTYLPITARSYKRPIEVNYVLR